MPHKRPRQTKLRSLASRWLGEKDSSRPGAKFLALAVGVGIFTGLAATLYRLALIWSHRLFFRQDSLLSSGQILDRIIAVGLPALGGLIVGGCVYRLLRIPGGHGVPALMKAVVTGNINLPPSTAVKSGLSVITMASGGSAGPEGPIVEIGAVMGTSLGRLAGVERRRMGTLVGCGAAAGIAAIFNAPLGGVVFALELILHEFTVPRFTPVVLAAVVASVVTQVLLPHQPAFRVPAGLVDSIEPDFKLIVAFGILGLLCALFSALYISGIYKAQDVFQRNVHLPTWLKPAFGGLLVGLMAIVLPGIQGEGYEFINERILEHANFGAALGAILILYALGKLLATALTLGSGFVGGSFAPAMFIGAALGAAFGVAAHQIVPLGLPSPAVFALVGMAGVVAGSLNAPLASILLIYEVTGGRYQILFPLMITVALAAALTRQMRPGSVYTMSLLRDGFDVEAATQQRDPLAGLTAADAMSTHVPCIPEDTTLNSIIDQLAETDAPILCVVSKKGEFRGLISVNDLRSVLTLGEEMGPLLLAGEIADPNPARLQPESPLSAALAIFSSSEAEAIPVVDARRKGKVAGVIYRRNLLSYYRRHSPAEASPAKSQNTS